MTNEDAWSDLSSGGDFESHESFKMAKGDKRTVTFQNDGRLVTKEMLKNSKYPKDNVVFHLKEGKKDFDWWVAKTSFGVRNLLNGIREKNGGSLEGASVVIERISDSATETNYAIVSA